METVKLKAEPRSNLGTKKVRELRATGMLPGIIYGHKKDPVPIALPAHELDVALAHGARTLHVTLDGKDEQYLIKEVQYDHLSTTVIHVDLTRVNLTDRVRVKVGIELHGVPKGCHEGGILDQSMANIEVECLVTEIPDTLKPAVTHLAIGESLRVKDMELPPGVTFLADPEDPVASVRAKAATAEEIEEAAEEAAEAQQPELIGRKAKEEEGEGG